MNDGLDDWLEHNRGKPMLITPHHREMNRRLHVAKGGYGSKGWVWAPRLIDIAQKLGIRSVLDYGCGKGSLKAPLTEAGLTVSEYDPAIPGKDTPPRPADLVVCTDVLEHVEPECLDDVIRHFVSLGRKAVVVAVACRPGKRVLEDGRPDHIIVESPRWWSRKFQEFGRFRSIAPLRKREYAAILKR